MAVSEKGAETGELWLMASNWDLDEERKNY